ncbi:MAG: magnesium transporter CorA family protein [Lachnospiraceae bacterium]|nr:magnesium transporter CorA family protein [Lachnospiraceae bacterium]
MLEIFKTTETGELVRLEKMEKDCWISLTAPSPDELDEVAELTGVEPDALRAALDEEERARIELEDTYHLILVDSPEIETELVDEVERKRYSTLPLAIITAKDLVITVTLRQTPILQYFKTGRIRDFFTYKKTRFILQVFYRVATVFLQYLRVINRESERLEDKLKESQRNLEIMEMHELEKALVYFTTAIRSNETVYEKLLKTEKVKRYPEDEDLLEDVIIENRQALEMANIYSGILNSTMDTFSSVISNNLNGVMKALATVTIVMSIPTMIASFYGMNVPLPGQNHPYGFLIVLGCAGLIASIVAIIFRKKDLF